MAQPRINYDKLKDVFSRFNVEGNVEGIEPFGAGLINKTYLIKTDVKDYMLQLINTYAFHNVDDLMRNIYIVTNHLRGLGKATLHVRKTKNQKIYVRDGNDYYRLYTYIKNTQCYEKLDSIDMIYKTGEAFGDLHCALADLDPILIAETIPNFHDTPKRYNDLLDAVKEDPVGRLQTAFLELNFILKHKQELSAIMEGLNNGAIPERIVHNDPKINNVLFDKTTGDFKCVIDLDTIMPGSCLFDFGDALRSLFTGDNESSRDTSLLKVDLEIFKSYAKGYLSKMKNSITEKEMELLPNSIFIIATELGIRFLEDYLRGDLYFRTTFEDENLVRAKGQLALAQDVLNHMDEMRQILKDIIGE